ncbi:MAG: carboxypeptidase regulatory-like domain-containing protein, partial [Limnochordia bacterium]|jgi:hypothetical protein
LIIALSPVILFGLGSPAAASSASVRYAPDKWAVLPKLDSGAAVRIDGRLQEAWWQEAATLTGFQTAYYERTLSHEAAHYRLAYDDQHLFVGGRLSVDEAESLHKIEIVLRHGASADKYYVVSIPVKGRHPASAAQLSTIWNPSLNELSSDEGRVEVRGFRFAASEQDDEFTVEAEIPFTALAAAGVRAGDEWQVNIIHVHHLYTKPLTSWIPIRQSNQWDNGHSLTGRSTSLYGNVIGQGRLGSIFFSRLPDAAGPQPGSIEEADLSYVSFQRKKLQFVLPDGQTGFQDVSLRWQSPGRAWQTLQEFEITQDLTGISVVFDHPKPLHDGTYKLMVTCYLDGERSLVSVMTFDREYMIEAGLATMPSSPARRGATAVARTEMSEEVRAVIDLIPPQPGFRYTGLPEMPDLFPDGTHLYRLNADKKSLTATPTGTIYPSTDPRWSESHRLVIKDKKGEEIEIPYYQDAKGKRYFVTGHLWYVQRQEAIKETSRIADKDPLGAARILYAFAQAYAGWHPTVDRDGVTGIVPADSGPPYAYWGGTWNRWWWGDLSSLAPLATVYERLKETDAFELLSAEVGEDVERIIVEEMFRPSVDFALTYIPSQGNMANSFWRGLIQIGRALGDSDMIHRAVELVRDFVTEGKFLSDGFWSEVTLSYHVQTINGLVSAIELLNGWSDPEGYVSPRTGLHLEDLDMASEFPIIAKALAINKIVVYPDGKYLPIQDTWGNATARQPDLSAGSFLLPASRIGRLVRGEGRNQTQLYLNFQPKYGHVHRDGLNITLFANGTELMPDLGYSHSSKYRWFTTSTMGHNTVVVDSQNMSGTVSANHGGNIEAFVIAEPFQLMRASYTEAYNSAEEYSRELWMVPLTADGEQVYVLDIFRVAGGRRHEYTLQGDANRDAFFEVDKSTEPYGPYLLPSGVRVTQPTGPSTSGSAQGHYAGYIYLRDVEQAELDDDRFVVTLFTEQSGIARPQLKMTGLLDAGENELFLARSPSMRPVRLNGIASDNNHLVDQHTMPKLVLRRDGQDLRSDFVTLLEPRFDDAGFRVEAIERLPIDDGPEGSVAVRIIYDDTIDVLLSNPLCDEGALVAGDITLEGEFGFIRLKDGVVREMSLVGGTRLSKGELTLEGDGRLQGEIVGTLRRAEGDEVDALISKTVLPADVADGYVIVRHPDGRTAGFKIGRIENRDEGSLIVLAEHDPGFVIDPDGSSRQLFHPRFEWQGTHTFDIALMNHATGLAGPSSLREMTGLVSGTVYGPEGEPIEGAVVHVAGYTTPAATTDAFGRFRLSRIPGGRQWLKTTHKLYASSVSPAVEITHEGTQITLTLGDRLPPQLSGVPSEVESGESIPVICSVDATVYLVEGSSSRRIPDAERVRANAVSQVTVAAEQPALLPTQEELFGPYILYAVDQEGRVSAGATVYIENQAELERLWQFFDNWQW